MAAPESVVSHSDQGGGRHVVCLFRADAAAPAHHGSSATLSNAAVAELCATAAPWRDLPTVRKRLGEIAREKRWAALGVWLGAPADVVAVQPLEVGLEPTLLDETDPTIGDLSATGVELLSGDGSSTPRPAATRTARWLIRSGVPMFIIPQQFCLLLMHLTLQPTWVGVGAAYGPILLVLAALWLFFRLRRETWWLVPGGVIIRRAGRGTLVTGADGPLIITKHAPGYIADICGPRPYRRRLTQRECIALLAAWSSRTPTPNDVAIAAWLRA